MIRSTVGIYLAFLLNRLATEISGAVTAVGCMRLLCRVFANTLHCYSQYPQQNHYQAQSILNPMCNDTRSCILQLVCHKRQAQGRQYQRYQIPLPKHVKQVPQNSVYQPRPLPVTNLLTRQNVSAPPKFFPKDVKTQDQKIHNHDPPISL